VVSSAFAASGDISNIMATYTVNPSVCQAGRRPQFQRIGTFDLEYEKTCISWSCVLLPSLSRTGCSCSFPRLLRQISVLGTSAIGHASRRNTTLYPHRRLATSRSKAVCSLPARHSIEIKVEAKPAVTDVLPMH
jgi:hypothetical protein